MSEAKKERLLISGGSRGIGEATAFLLKEHYDVYAPSSKELDVTDHRSIDAYCSSNKLDQGIYALVCNAGIYQQKPFLKQSFEEWQRIIDVNLHGVFNLCQKIIPGMIERNHKHDCATSRIVIISSVSASGEAYASAYAASKAALLGLSKSLSMEFAKDKITVNTICPGWVRTDMAKNCLNTAEKEAANIGATLQNRWIEPDEVAHMVKYLISEEAYAVTGQSIEISAGL